MTTRSTPLERRLLLLVLGLGLWLCATMPVFAQEAYYWCYAQHPALSYFDHPPMVAWTIRLGTELLGDGALGLRLFTFLFGFGTSWLGAVWLRQLGLDPWVRCGWIVCSIGMPLLLVLHFLATPDPPLVFFWTLSMVALRRAREGSFGWWLAAGAAAGCALLGKYAAAFLAVGGLIVLIGDPKMRAQWKRPGLYAGVLAACAVFLPVILWNLGNDFESFRFQTEGRWSKGRFGAHWIVQFLAGQLGVMHPVVAILIPASTLWILRRAFRRDEAAVWLAAFGLPMPLFFLGNSLFIQVKINWLLPNFLPLSAGVLWWWLETGKRAARPESTRRLAKIVLWTGLVAAAVAPVIRVWPQIGGSSWAGWDRFAERARHWAGHLRERSGDPSRNFYFASSYRDSAQLLRSLKLLGEERGQRGLPVVLSQNVFGQRALEFDHWEAPQDHVGADAIFVLPRPGERPTEVEKLKAHFDSVQQVERVRVEFLAWTVADAAIFEARGYRGPGG
ncbi:MAG: hypothetical protein Fur0037_10720 [Planctomycetota bacterium]